MRLFCQYWVPLMNQQINEQPDFLKQVIRKEGNIPDELIHLPLLFYHVKNHCITSTRPSVSAGGLISQSRAGSNVVWAELNSTGLCSSWTLSSDEHKGNTRQIYWWQQRLALHWILTGFYNLEGLVNNNNNNNTTSGGCYHLMLYNKQIQWIAYLQCIGQMQTLVGHYMHVPNDQKINVRMQVCINK